MPAIPCRIRSRRKALGFTQREFATLVGLRSQGLASDIEAGRKLPSIRTALKCGIVLNASVPELFPRLQWQMTREVISAARQMKRAPEGKAASRRTAEQLALLSNRLTQEA